MLDMISSMGCFVLQMIFALNGIFLKKNALVRDFVKQIHGR